MKRKSILTTQFPRLGFHHYTINEIDGHFCDGINSGNDGEPPLHQGFIAPFICRRFTDGTIVKLLVSRFLPTFSVEGKTFYTNLVYEEKDGDSTVFQTSIIESSDTSGPAGAEKRTQGACQIFLGFAPAGETKQRLFSVKNSDGTFKQILDQLFSSDATEITINLHVYVAKQLTVSKAASESPRAFDKRMAERKYLIAKEIVTIYRHYVERVQGILAHRAEEDFQSADGVFRRKVLLSEMNNLNRVAHGRPGPDHDLHSTNEDARRLICSFDTISDALRKVGIESKGAIDIPTYGAFIRSFTSGARYLAADKVLADLETTERIPVRVGFKKLLEYFIFEALPCEVSSCR
jgi:hypothetical protein